MILVLDRIEKTQNGKRIAIFENGDSFFNIHEDNMPPEFINELKTGMILEAEIKDNILISPIILINETEEKQNEMNNRLNKLFDRNKK